MEEGGSGGFFSRGCHISLTLDGIRCWALCRRDTLMCMMTGINAWVLLPCLFLFLFFFSLSRSVNCTDRIACSPWSPNPRRKKAFELLIPTKPFLHLLSSTTCRWLVVTHLRQPLHNHNNMTWFVVGSYPGPKNINFTLLSSRQGRFSVEWRPRWIFDRLFAASGRRLGWVWCMGWR